MKTKIFFLLVFLFAATYVYSQSLWKNQNTGTTANIHSIHFADLHNGWAVGEGGKIIKTTNYGNNWVNQTSGISTDLNGVFFINSQTGWVVGNGGNILYTDDGGANWQSQISNTTNHLQDIAFANDSVGWIIGASNSILKTTDGGNTWIAQTSNVFPNLYSISVVDTNIVYASGFSGPSIGRVIKTTDGGNTWQALSTATATLNGVFFINENTGWAVGNNGTIIYTTDGGANWASQSSNISEILLDVFFINDTIGWAVGMGGKVLYTENAGTTWESMNTGVSVNLLKIFFFNEYRGWLCGNGGRIQFNRTSEEICLVTVDTLTYKNMIIWERILNQRTDYYNVYKYSVGNTYQIIGTVPFDDMSLYIDYSSTPETNSERYKISAVDSLGYESDLSPYHQTINLQVAQGVPPTTVVLSWNEYVDESGKFIPSAYTIFKGSSPTNLMEHVVLPGVNVSYNDLNITSIQYYQLAVIKPSPCYPSSTDRLVGGPYSGSYSNMEETNFGHDFIDKIVFGGNIIIMPNPMNNYAVLNIPNINNQTALINSKLTITDITGKVVHTISENELIDLITNKSSAIEIILNRNNLNAGIYFIELLSDKVYRGKLIVE